VCYEAFYLLSPLLLLSRAMSDPDCASHWVARRLFPFVHTVERRLVRAFPALQAECWMVLAYGQK
jgi:hypothetical protein